MVPLITHLRAAERFLGLPGFIPEYFIAGSAAPDFGGLIPKPHLPSAVTHFSSNGDKDGINWREFYEAYVKPEQPGARRSFYLGYYVHLLTDSLWYERVWLPAAEKFRCEIARDRGFIKKIKAGWENNDRLFIRENPGFRPFEILNAAPPDDFAGLMPRGAYESMAAGINKYCEELTGGITAAESIFLPYEKHSEILRGIIREIEIKL